MMKSPKNHWTFMAGPEIGGDLVLICQVSHACHASVRKSVRLHVVNHAEREELFIKPRS